MNHRQTEPGPNHKTETQTGDTRAAWERIVDAAAAHWWPAAALVALVLVLYAPTVGFDYVNWDDPWYVTDNPLITSWHPSNLLKIATEVVSRNYAPVTIFSYLVDHTLWGKWPGGFHLTNLILHAVNAVLAYLLIARLAGSRTVGWVCAALFAVHPVQLETVAWISSRKGLLSGAFILAALICWLRPERTGRQEAWGLGFFVLALLSKAIAVVVPAVVLAYDMLILRKKFSEAFPRQVIPGFLSLMLLLATMSAQVTIVGGVRDHLQYSKAWILLIDATILWRYVGMLLWPTDLCVLYDVPTEGIAGQMTVAVCGWLVVALVLYRLRHRCPRLCLAAVTTLVFLLPVLNLFPITTLMNDRYLYLPALPAFAVLVGGLNQTACWLASRGAWLQKLRLAGPATLLAGTLAVSGAFLMSMERLPVWRNGLALWEDAMQKSPGLTVVWIQHADALREAGQNQRAVETLRRALVRTEPDQADRRRIQKKIITWSLQPAERPRMRL